MVLDTGGLSIESKTTGDREWAQNALLTVDAATGKLNATPAYYVFRHVSQYVDAGASVLATTGGDALAFKNPDGSITTIIFNSEAAKTLTVAVGGRKLQFQIPGDGWATLIAK
jgi:glucosylceramidase